MEVAKFSQKSLFYFTLFAALILMIIALIIYPDFRYLKSLDQNIKLLNTKIETQKLLFPLFQKMLAEMDLKLPEGVVFPKQEKLTQQKAEGIVSIFHDLAGDSRLAVLEVSPDVDSTLGASGFMLVNVVLQGDFIAFHEFLLALGALPYLEKVEQIKLQTTEGGLEFRIKTWLLKEAKETR